MVECGGKYIFGTVKVGTKGQIVIPKEARDRFGIAPGDTLMMLGDAKSGLAVITNDDLLRMLSKAMEAER